MPLKDKEKLKAYRKAYYELHKVAMSPQYKSYRIENKDKLREYFKARYETKKLDINSKRKVYRDANKEKMRAQKKIQYGRENVEKRRIRCKIYHENNIEKFKIARRKRRAKIRGVKHEPYNTNYIFLRDNWTCGICGRKINKRLKHPNLYCASIDHIVPISKGGQYIPSNVQAAHLRCNLSKYNVRIGQLRLFG